MFGKHAAYIIPSYGITVLIIAALVVWIMVVYRNRQNELAQLEAMGIKRAGSNPGVGAADANSKAGGN